MKKIFLLFNKVNKKNKKTICVVGVSPKSGVTHLCLSMANFLHSVLRQKVVYVELREDSSLLSVVGLNQVKLAGTIGYKYKGVTYILTGDVNEVMELMMSIDAWFIIDMKELNEETKTIFTNCDKRIVIGSLRPWCIREYYFYIEKINKIKMNNSSVTYLGYKMNNNKNEKIIKKIEKIYISEAPIIEDPFSLKEKEFEALIDIIK